MGNIKTLKKKMKDDFTGFQKKSEFHFNQFLREKQIIKKSWKKLTS